MATQLTCYIDGDVDAFLNSGWLDPIETFGFKLKGAKIPISCTSPSRTSHCDRMDKDTVVNIKYVVTEINNKKLSRNSLSNYMGKVLVFVCMCVCVCLVVVMVGMRK